MVYTRPTKERSGHSEAPVHRSQTPFLHSSLPRSPNSRYVSRVQARYLVCHFIIPNQLANHPCVVDKCVVGILLQYSVTSVAAASPTQTMTDRHIFDDHSTLVLRSLTGLVKAHPNLSLLPATKTVINADQYVSFFQASDPADCIISTSATPPKSLSYAGAVQATSLDQQALSVVVYSPLVLAAILLPALVRGKCTERSTPYQVMRGQS